MPVKFVSLTQRLQRPSLIYILPVAIYKYVEVILCVQIPNYVGNQALLRHHPSESPSGSSHTFLSFQIWTSSSASHCVHKCWSLEHWPLWWVIVFHSVCQSNCIVSILGGYLLLNTGVSLICVMVEAKERTLSENKYVSWNSFQLNSTMNSGDPFYAPCFAMCL